MYIITGRYLFRIIKKNPFQVLKMFFSSKSDKIIDGCIIRRLSIVLYKDGPFATCWLFCM